MCGGREHGIDWAREKMVSERLREARKVRPGNVFLED